jgi:hypothetical protein
MDTYVPFESDGVIDTTAEGETEMIADADGYGAIHGEPGIYQGIPNEVYHASRGVSKSGLWTIHTQTPAHFKFPPPAGEISTTKKATQDFGTASHTAILEPELFEAQVLRGPDDRRGNNWKDAVGYAEETGRVCLVASDYDNILTIRDAIHANARINAIITGGRPEVEASGYAIDPVTGLLIRCRPDLYRADLGIMLDAKSTASAHPDAFARSVVNYGYHAQEAHYSDTYRLLDRPVEGFLFLAWEKESPFAFALYELPPSIVEEGRAIIRKSLDTYAECSLTNHWPAYGDEITELKFQRWSYSLTQAPEQEAA